MKIDVQMKLKNTHIIQQWEVENIEAALRKFREYYQPLGWTLEKMREHGVLDEDHIP